MKQYDILGIGNALMDIQAFVPDSLLTKLNLPKGIMHLIEENTSRDILNSITEHETVSLPGGSCANTLSIIALLGGHAVYTGIVVDDFYGRLYESKLIDRGIKSLIIKKHKGLTGSCIVLTTEDAERTMSTHLGVCRDLSKDDIDLETLKESKIMHCTGYQWDTVSQKEAVELAMKEAQKEGLKISFDIADPFCISRNVSDIKNIITNYVDILFGNYEEAKILTGKSDPVEAGKIIKEMGPEIVIVKVGSDGSYLFYEDKIEKIDIYEPEKVLDSTGCGDIYAGGFLYGYTKGYDLIKCARTASFLAARIIGVPGVKLEALDLNSIKKFIEEKL